MMACRQLGYSAVAADACTTTATQMFAVQRMRCQVLQLNTAK
jgi:hypothetical protein